ncbi:hypothetical protein AJ88_13440 [Mesorhizobium amorphae CCBAU 01583]|nr:hypothetical protein AJ88_13440 [Mesorhizobium amorphae CCBAU 01583]
MRRQASRPPRRPTMRRCSRYPGRSTSSCSAWEPTATPPRSFPTRTTWRHCSTRPRQGSFCRSTRPAPASRG